MQIGKPASQPANLASQPCNLATLWQLHIFADGLDFFCFHPASDALTFTMDPSWTHQKIY
jgi:hypothetical protein